MSRVRVEVKRGEQIRFVLKNDGELAHEFVLATTADNLKHAALMRNIPTWSTTIRTARRFSPRERRNLWRFTKRGEFEYGCLIPGHREAGMTGKVVVK